nr:hypothetical protein [Pandoravirus belohorizontensis]
MHSDLAAPNPPTEALGAPTVSERRTHPNRPNGRCLWRQGPAPRRVSRIDSQDRARTAPAASAHPALAPTGTCSGKMQAGGDPNERGASRSPDAMSQERPSDKSNVPGETTIDDDGDDLSEEYDDAVRQMSEPDGDWKREWLDANKEKLLSVLREEERVLAAGTST